MTHGLSRINTSRNPSTGCATVFLGAWLIAAVVFLGVAAASSQTVLAVDMGSKAQTVEEPETYRTDDYRKPVPSTLKGAKVLSAEEARALWTTGSAIFIDVYPHAPKPDNLPASTIWR